MSFALLYLFIDEVLISLENIKAEWFIYIFLNANGLIFLNRARRDREIIIIEYDNDFRKTLLVISRDIK